MKLFENWRKYLNETSDEKFLQELEPLLKQWKELQASYGDTPPEGMPDYVKKSPGYYGQYSKHTGGRRAVYAQTPEEETLEKQLIRLFMKHSDQDYLTSDEMMWAHNLNYKAHAQQGWSSSGLQFADFSRTSYVGAQETRQRKVLSCYGFQKNSLHGFYGSGGYGFFVQPTRVIYASKTDLASQTTRTAHADVQARFTGGTFPKRAGLDRIKSRTSGKMFKNFGKWRRWYKNAVQMLPREMGIKIHTDFMDAMSKMKGPEGRNTSNPEVAKITDKVLKAIELTGQQIEPPELMTPQQVKILRDATLLNEQDIAANNGRVEEALLANWTVKAWYFSESASHNGPFPAKFWRQILPEIVVPIYTINQYADGMDQLREISKEEMMRMFK
tara:strand:+ start:5907 stop:7064 length:1158 start_codon:yes stop_codon:yes gene_type:complete